MTGATAVWRRTFAAVIVAALLLPACSRGDDDADTGEEPATTTVASSVPVEPRVTVSGETPDDAPAQLDVSLGEGSSSDVAPTAVELVDGTPIDEEGVADIVGALPAWNVPDDDVDDDGFVRPPQTLPPPQVGETNETPFPPPGDPAGPGDVDPGPLEVLRYQPEGDGDVAPFLSVTFNQPMVPVGTLDQLASADGPVDLTPEIDGRWRWIGTRTLRFELVPGVIDRLPAATEYVAEVPAGTTAANGAELAETVTWTFATPPPTVVSFVGASDSVPLDPVFVAVFDQRVDPAAVLATVSLTADGDDSALRLATDDEVADDEPAAAAVGSALDARTVAFTPVVDLDVDAALAIDIGPGTPSAEGPRTSTDVASFSARTFGALRVTESTCGFDDDCVPGSPFVLTFSNALDPDAFEPDQVAVAPEVPGLRVVVSGSSIELSGATTGRTTYTVTLAGELQDVFGQTLGDEQEFEFEVGPARPALVGFDQEFVTVDPAGDDKTISVTTVNHDAVHVTAWGVTPTDLAAFREYYDSQWSDTEPPVPDWPVIIDEEVAIDADPDEIVETAIDLTSAFEQVGSQLVVRVESTETYAPDDDDYWRNRPSVAWVQSTTLGVDAFFDTDESP
jgi:hypothetical protein